MDLTKTNQIEKIVADFLLTELQAIRITPSQAASIAELFLEVLPEDITEQQTTAILLRLNSEFFNLLKTGQFKEAKQFILEISHE